MHKSKLAADGLSHLASRLRHSVVNAGLRKISAGYSRIRLADIAARFGVVDSHLSSLDVEMIVAKAISDGVIDATIDHENGELLTHDASNTYETDEPHQALHRRIRFCLDLHNEAVKV